MGVKLFQDHRSCLLHVAKDQFRASQQLLTELFELHRQITADINAGMVTVIRGFGHAFAGVGAHDADHHPGHPLRLLRQRRHVDQAGPGRDAEFDDADLFDAILERALGSPQDTERIRCPQDQVENYFAGERTKGRHEQRDGIEVKRLSQPFVENPPRDARFGQFFIKTNPG